MWLSSGSLKVSGVAGLNTGGSAVMGVAIRRGATRVRRCKPMVFMARAAAPMLAGWLVRQRMTWMLLR